MHYAYLVYILKSYNHRRRGVVGNIHQTKNGGRDHKSEGATLLNNIVAFEYKSMHMCTLSGRNLKRFLFLVLNSYADGL